MAKSTSMKDLISRSALAAAQRRVIPLMANESSMEVPSLARRIGAEMSSREYPHGLTPDRIVIAPERSLAGNGHPRYLLEKLLTMQDARGVVFFRDDLNQGVQDAFTRQLLAQYHLIIVVMTKSAADLHKSGAWITPFYRMCTETRTMPTWRERNEDKLDLLKQLEQRLPQGTKLGRSAINILKKMTFAGIDQVKREIDRAYGVMLKEQHGGTTYSLTEIEEILAENPDADITRVITADHIGGSALRALSSHRPKAKIKPNERRTDPPNS